ncbi:GGDEF domain-containing protein [Chitinimonas koreensis]|uniref:GGDEF domain-containing protein n=1 Tax=Chitinimonas koreensis TaxID=356302 RepID=UPI0004167750|nr:GGDEF domain-containing protein [Chitinimonas koreensis]QNM97718.1 diguanylate cyclase [Chitinimonas koreensis]
MNPKLLNPTDIARETLRQLAARRIAPTPERYEELYHEIAGEGSQPNPQATLAGELVRALKALPRQNGDLLRLTSQAERLSQAKEWAQLVPVVVQAIETQDGQASLARNWSELIHELINQWELRSPHFTSARKRESLAKVLLNFGNYPNLLNEKLDALVRSWSEGASGGSQIDVAGIDASGEARAPGAVDAAGPALAAVPASGLDWQRWRELLVQTLRHGLADRLQGMPDLAEEAISLALAAETAASEQALDLLVQRLRKFWIQLELRSERDNRITSGLVNLLVLLSDNMAALSGDDEWVSGQLAVVRDILSRPLSVTRLYEVEAGFKEVVFKQGQLRHSLDDAQERIKHMLSLFIDRLGSMADTTGGYHDRIEAYASRIASAQHITDLQQLLDELMQDTRVMQLDMARSREELLAARHDAEAASQRVAELEQELRAISEKVREDQLTGALNRRGFEEAFATEIARAERSSKSLCLALLDIDNFKKLNDQRGHQAGDDALVHLVAVIRDVLRPTDVIARYGGEEFVVLLPETALSEAANTMRRVQRELTKRFFLHNNERVLITFSAGVTRFVADEHPEATLERADQAMYEAKKSGKNQVIVAEAGKAAG